MTLLEALKKINWEGVRIQKSCLQAVIYKLTEDGFTLEGRMLENTITLLRDFQELGAAMLGQENHEQIYGKKSKNENCLQNVKCPKCGHEDDFNITVASVVSMTDNGTDFEGADADWDGMSIVRCGSCGRHGRAWEFTAG